MSTKKIISQEEFELFKLECKRLMNKIELNNWEVCFVLKKLDEGVFAEIETKLDGASATITLNKVWDLEGIDNFNESFKRTAKHEVIHLLLARMSEYGKSKDYTTSNIYEAEEELVRKLENLID